MGALRNRIQGRAGCFAGMSPLRVLFLLAAALAGSAAAFLLGGAPAAVLLLATAIISLRLRLERRQPPRRAVARMPARVLRER